MDGEPNTLVESKLGNTGFCLQSHIGLVGGAGCVRSEEKE